MENGIDDVVEALKDIKTMLLLLIATNMRIMDSLPQPPGKKPMRLDEALTDTEVLYRNEKGPLRNHG